MILIYQVTMVHLSPINWMELGQAIVCLELEAQLKEVWPS